VRHNEDWTRRLSVAWWWHVGTHTPVLVSGDDTIRTCTIWRAPVGALAGIVFVVPVFLLIQCEYLLFSRVCATQVQRFGRGPLVQATTTIGFWAGANVRHVESNGNVGEAIEVGLEQ
jgi:hypothetical protein